MPALSEWLQLMLAEIARKREDLERAREEETKREAEAKRDAETKRDTETKRETGGRGAKMVAM
jgi:hypothetical protein